MDGMDGYYPSCVEVEQPLRNTVVKRQETTASLQSVPSIRPTCMNVLQTQVFGKSKLFRLRRNAT